MVIPSGPTSCTGGNSRLPPVLDLPDVVDRRCYMIFLLQLSPKVDMNPLILTNDTNHDVWNQGHQPQQFLRGQSNPYIR